MSSDEEDNVLSVLEYAQLHGIATDHLAESSLSLSRNLLYLPADCSIDVDDNVVDPFNRSMEDLLRSLTHEKLEVFPEAMTYLQFALELPHLDYWDDILSSSRPSKLKVDLPILRTNHNDDLKLISRQPIEELDPGQLSPLSISEPETDELAQGLGLQLAHCRSRARCEKLRISKHALDMLQSLFDMEDECFSRGDPLDDIPVRKPLRDLPVTPPLLPIIKESNNLRPSSPMHAASPFSELSGLTAAELEEIERAVFRDDSIAPEEGEIIPSTRKDFANENCPKTLLDFIEASSHAFPSSSPARPRACNLKVDVPMTPAMSRSPAKTVTFSDAIEKIPESLREWMQTDDIDSDQDYVALFQDYIEPAAFAANEAIVKQQLQVADGLLRVKVPDLDFYVPPSPWSHDLPKPQDDISSLMLPLSKMRLHHWPGISKLERDMLWIPFSSVQARQASKETMQCDASIYEKYTSLPDPSEIVNIEASTWKPDGLRLLDDTASDDEPLIPLFLLPHQHTTPPPPDDDDNDLLALIRKRKATFNSLPAPPSTDETFLASLHALQTRHTTTTTITRYLSPSPPPQPYKRPRLSPPLPSLLSPQPYQIVLSSNTLLNRPLLHHLTSALPNLILTERPILASDILLSPSTGLLLTPLQKLRQRPALPAKFCTAVQRILTASATADLVLVLVEPAALQPSSEDVRTALGEVVKLLKKEGVDGHFSPSLPLSLSISNVSPELEAKEEGVRLIYTTSLFAQIVNEIMRYASYDQNVKYLTPAASQWETSLCEAGMNSFAAQIVLARMHELNINLARFVSMTYQERVGLFGDVVSRKMLRGFEKLWMRSGEEDERLMIERDGRELEG